MRSHAYANCMALSVVISPMSRQGCSVSCGYAVLNSTGPGFSHQVGMIFTATGPARPSIMSTLPWLLGASCRFFTNLKCPDFHGCTLLATSSAIWSRAASVSWLRPQGSSCMSLMHLSLGGEPTGNSERQGSHRRANEDRPPLRASELGVLGPPLAWSLDSLGLLAFDASADFRDEGSMSFRSGTPHITQSAGTLVGQLCSRTGRITCLLRRGAGRASSSR
mmetsp:Transcript_126880/g.359036  ORF Transcript_126880/g.359036 Transcript_126880/m.359036 type:complete len:221 (+) Transcript_126880:859-1521(+)